MAWYDPSDARWTGSAGSACSSRGGLALAAGSAWSSRQPPVSAGAASSPPAFSTCRATAGFLAGRGGGAGFSQVINNWLLMMIRPANAMKVKKDVVVPPAITFRPGRADDWFKGANSPYSPARGGSCNAKGTLGRGCFSRAIGPRIGPGAHFTAVRRQVTLTQSASGDRDAVPLPVPALPRG